MGNPYKINIATQSNCISKGNFHIGVADYEFGVTAVTDFYAGLTPPSGGYTWYKSSGAGAHIRTAPNDAGLVRIVNEENPSLGLTGVGNAIQYINSNPNWLVMNRDYPNIPTSGLTLLIDIGLVSSYPTIGNTASSLDPYSRLGASQSFGGGPVYTTNNGGGMVFDGVDDASYMDDSSGAFGVPLTAAFTNIVICRSTAATWNSWGGISSNRYSDGTGWIIHNNSGTTNVTFYMGDTTSPSAVTIGTKSGITITSPHMYGISSNGSNSHKAYFDADPAIISTTSATRASATHEWFIGRDGYLARYNAIEFYVALYYNRQLSDAEVSSIYTAYSSRFGW